METCDTQPPSRSFTAPSDLSDVSVSCSLSNSDSRAAVADLRDGQDDVTCSANDDGSDRSCQGGVTSPDSVTEGDEQHRCCRSQGRCGPFDPSLTSGASCCSNRLFLSVVDNIVVGLLIGPLTVLYWRGTWTMLDYQLFPGNKAASGWLCMAFGNIGLMVVVYAQNVLERRLRRGAVDWRTVDWILGYHLYTYVLGLLNVCHWRGLWALIDHYTGMSPASVWITFVVGKFNHCFISVARVR
jgi:hypothetical protein